MSPPLTAEVTSAEPLSISALSSDRIEIPDFDSIRDCINWLVAWAQEHGSDIGYRQMSRLYHRAKVQDAERVDTELGLNSLDAGEGRLGQDRTFAQDPTGESAVRNVMRTVAQKK